MTSKSSNPKFPKPRIYSIDFFKFVAIFVVILHHTHIFNHSYEYYGTERFLILRYFFYNIRYGIPFFFIAAGYFFGLSVQKGEPPLKLGYEYCRRLLQLFLIWSVVYTLIPPDVETEAIQFGYIKTFFWHWSTLPQYIYNLVHDYYWSILLTGVEGHLWFFPGYILSIIYLTFFLVIKQEKLIVPVGLFIYLFLLAKDTISKLPAEYHVWMGPHRLPLHGILFVSIGWWFSKNELPYSRSIQIKLALWLLIGGNILQFLEAFYLWSRFDVSPQIEYYLGLIPVGIGAFLLTINYPNFGRGSLFSKIGTYTLGIYATHEIFINTLKPFSHYFHPVVWDIFLPLAVLGCSYYLTLQLHKSPWTQWMVLQGRKKKPHLAQTEIPLTPAPAPEEFAGKA